MSAKMPTRQSRSFRNQLVSGSTEQIFKNKLNAILKSGVATGKKGSDIDNLLWEFYMNLQKGYAGVFEFTGGEDANKLNEIKPFIVELLWWNGKGALKKFEEQIGIYYIEKNEKKGIDGFTKSADCKSKYGNDEVKIIAGKNGAFIQTDVYSFPWFLFIDAYLKPMLEDYRIMPQELQNSLARVTMYVTGDQEKNDTLMEQIETQANTDSLIKVINSDAKMEHDVLDVNSINDKIWQDFKEHFNFMKLMRGMKTNVSEKESGVAQEEVLQNNEQIEVVVENFLTFLKRFCKMWNKAYDTNIDVRRKTYGDSIDQEQGKEKDSDSDESKSNQQTKD